MNGKRYRNTAFLIELMVNVFVLCISCAVLVGVFVEASLVVRETNLQNAAGSEVYALLQTVKVGGEEALEAEEVDGVLLCHYDEGWQRTDAAGAVYTIRLYRGSQTREAGVLHNWMATAITAEGEELCVFTTSIYVPEGGGAL